MPVDESKLYLELKGKLENLSKGINKHSADKDFPSNIAVLTVDTKITELTNARKDYDEAATVASQKSEAYNAIAKTGEELFSGISTQLYGVYGKQNLTVEDYGLKVYQKPTGRKSKANTAATK
jgi:hypothetical protein